MTTFTQIALTCPVCDQSFTSQRVASTNSFGGKRTDFHERAAGTQPLPFLVHTCKACGWTGQEADAQGTPGAGVPLDERVRAWVLEEITPAHHAAGARGQPLTGSEKYERAAKIGIQAGDEARLGADLWLRAAWCTVDEGDVEAERYYRLRAADWWARALAEFDGVEPKERAVYTYLVGELQRRIGDRAQAHAWFGRVAGEITDVATQHWVLDAARQQDTCAREWFG